MRSWLVPMGRAYGPDQTVALRPSRVAGYQGLPCNLAAPYAVPSALEGPPMPMRPYGGNAWLPALGVVCAAIVSLLGAPGAWATQPDASDKPKADPKMPTNAPASPGKPAKQNDSPPAADPSSLPQPTLGFRFTNPKIVDAAKLIEAREFGAASAILQNQLKDPNLTGDSKAQVRAGQAMILIRAGQLVKANEMLTGLVNAEVADSGIRDND